MSKENQSELITPPNTLNSAVATDFWTTLNNSTGKDVMLDMSGVEMIGGQCMELIVSAKKMWEKEDRKFHIVKASDSLVEDLILLGFSNLADNCKEEESA